MVHKWFHDYAFTIHGKQHEYKKELKVNITFIIGIDSEIQKQNSASLVKSAIKFVLLSSIKRRILQLFYARNLSHITTIIDKTYIKSEATISYRRGLRKCHTSSKPFYQRLDISNYKPSKRISYTQTSSDLYNLIYDSNKYSLC